MKRSITDLVMPYAHACDNFTNQLKVMRQHVEWQDTKMREIIQRMESAEFSEEELDKDTIEVLKRTFHTILYADVYLKGSLKHMNKLTMCYHKLLEN